MPELRKDPIVGRWVIIATERAKRPRRSQDGAAAVRRLLPILRGQRGQDAARDPRLPRARHPAQRDRAGASASCPTSSPPCRSRATCSKRGDGIYDTMNGIGAHEVIIEMPVPRNDDGHPLRGEHPRGPLGLPRSAGRPEEGPAAGVRHAVQERRGRGRRLAGALALAVDRHADRADQRLGGDDRLRWSSSTTAAGASTATWSSRSWHGREADRAGHAQLRRASAPSPAASRSRPGSCPRTTPATSRTSRRPRWTTWASSSRRS